MTDHPPAPSRGRTAPRRRGGPATTVMVVVGALAVLVATVMTTLLITARGPASGDGDAAAPRPGTRFGATQARVQTPPALEPAPAQDQVLVEEPQDVVPVERGRIDFTAVTCAMIGDEAVYISQSTPDLLIRLIDVRDTHPIEDLRPQYPLPAPGGESTVMSCGGTGDWDDSSSSDVYLELTVDSAGLQYVYYLRE